MHSTVDSFGCIYRRFYPTLLKKRISERTVATKKHLSGYGCAYPFFIHPYPHSYPPISSTPHEERYLFQIYSPSQAMSTFQSDRNTPVWPAEEGEHYFRDLVIRPLRQRGPTCVSTCLAMLTGKRPEDFQGNINTQDPVSWSAALQPYGMKLAYCPHDARKLKFYIEELIALDDLFALSFYTTEDPKEILADADSNWLCYSIASYTATSGQDL